MLGKGEHQENYRLAALALFIVASCSSLGAAAGSSIDAPNATLCIDRVPALGDTAITQDGSKIYVTDPVGERVFVLSTESGAMEAVIPTGGEASGLVFSSDGKKIYSIVNKNDVGSIVEIAVDIDSISHVYPLGAGKFHGIAYDKKSRTMFTVRSDEAIILRFRLSDLETSYIPLDREYVDQIIWDEKHSRLYGSGAKLIEIDIAHDGIKKIIDIGEKSSALAINDQKSQLAVSADGAPGTVYLIDTAKDLVKSKLPVGNDPGSVAFSPDGNRLYVANVLPNPMVSMYKGKSRLVEGPGEFFTVDATQGRLVGNLRFDVGQGALAVAPRGDRVYATTLSGDVAAIETSNNSISGLFPTPDSRVRMAPAVKPDTAKENSCS